MDFAKNLQQIDKGRLVAVPVFTLLLLLNIISFFKGSKALLPANTIQMTSLINKLLIIFFYGLVIFLYFLRSSASSTVKSFWTKAIAIIAAFLPFTLPLLGTHKSGNSLIIFAANFIIISGLSFSLYALFVLGKSFSIIPQARRLVQDGPYRLVRHPLYLSEMVAVSGIVLTRYNISTLALFLLLILCQVYRALQEEILLMRTFPSEYENYCLKTPRFIPGIF